MAKKLEWTAALLLTALAVVLHVSHFRHAGGLWRDEAAAVGLATQPSVAEVFQTFPHEAFPLVFPLAVRTWVGVTGGGDPALRLFGLLVGLALLAALWWNAWSATRHPPLVSLALLGMSPTFFQYGGSIRGYGLGAVFLLLAFGLLAATFLRPGRNVRIAALVFALLAVHCLIPSWSLLGALCLAAAVACLWRRNRWGAAVALGIGLVAALSLLPYAGPLSRAREWNLVVQSPSPVDWAVFWKGLSDAAGLIAPVRWLWFLALLLALVGGVRVLGARPALPPEGEPGRDRSLFGLLLIPLATCAFFLFLSLLRYDPRPWYFLPLLALLASDFDLLAAGLGTSAGRRLPLAGGALVVGVLLFLPARPVAAVRQTNVDLLAATVTRAAAPGDLVLVNPWYNGVSFARYYRGKAPWMTLPEMTDHRFHRYDLLKERMTAKRPIDGVLESVGAALASGHRVWVVGGLHVPPPGSSLRTLPPAPLSPYRWFDVPYEVAWSEQAGTFLRAHAARVGEVKVPAPDLVSNYERLKLLVFDGWR